MELPQKKDHLLLVSCPKKYTWIYPATPAEDMINARQPSISSPVRPEDKQQLRWSSACSAPSKGFSWGPPCLSPAQWMLSLFPPSWQMPALQNKDDISAVVLGFRKGIILASASREAAHKGGCMTLFFVPRQGGPWRTQPRPNTRTMCGDTCAHTRGSVPSQVPGPVAHLCQLPPEPSPRCPRAQSGSCAGDKEPATLGRPETGTYCLFCRLLKIEGLCWACGG